MISVNRNNTSNDRKKKFLAFGITVSIGASIVLYLTQQNVEAPVVAEKQVEKVIEKKAESLLAKALIAPEIKKEEPKEVEKAIPMTREEVIAKASRELRERSTFKERMLARQEQAYAKLEMVEAQLAKNPTHNETIKNTLGIDAKETFGIDYDEKMRELQQRKQSEDTAELERRLLAGGVNQHQVDEIKRFRQKVLDIQNGQGR